VTKIKTMQRQSWAFMGLWAFIAVAAWPLFASAGSLDNFAYGPEDRIITVYLGPEKFRIPGSYFTGKPKPEWFLQDNHWKGFDFAFWFPDLRPTQARGAYLTTFRPSESDRIASPSSSFVVRVTSVRRIEGPLESPNFVRPALRHKNLMRYLGEALNTDERYGLTEHAHKRDPGQTYYYTEDAGKGETLIRCFASPLLPNPICDAQTFLEKQRFNIRYTFPADAIGQWKGINAAVERLLSKFQRIDS
jgi:hypothetical protein